MSNVVSLQREPQSLLDHALAYAAIGWKVLPLWHGTKQPCGKLVGNGHNMATTDEDTIRRWWAQVPTAGIGISLQASGLMAIDIDPRNGGLETIERLEAQHGPIVSDVLAFTGGGGEHRVFSLPPTMAATLPGKLGHGVDVKCNGYICVEPSVHPSGRQYVWEGSSSPLDGVAPTPLPDWIRGFEKGGSKLVDTLQSGEAFVGIGAQTWAEIESALSAISSDERETWIRIGQALHATGELDRAFKAWDAWSQTSSKYDPRDSLRVWRSFKARGLSGITYRSIFAMANAAGWRAPRLAAIVQDAIPADSMLVNFDALDKKAGALSWIVKHVFPAQSVGVIFGASGTFKSFCVLDGALHVAHGLPWLGQRTKRAGVVYVAAEGGVGLLRRVKAWHQAHKLDPRQADIHFIIVPVELLRDARAIRAEIEKKGLDVRLVVIDTLSQTYSGDENSSNEMAAYMREVRAELAQPLDACVSIIHHSGHGDEKRPRGSSAIRANTDFLFLVTRNEKEMLATFENQHQKDGELIDPAQFVLSVERLGTDEDGDPINSLVATVAGDVSQVVSMVKATGRNGKGSNRAMLLEVAVHGELAETVRKQFYERLGDKDQATKRRAWHDCINWAQDAGVIEIEAGSLGRILRRDPVDN